MPYHVSGESAEAEDHWAIKHARGEETPFYTCLRVEGLASEILSYLLYVLKVPHGFSYPLFRGIPQRQEDNPGKEGGTSDRTSLENSMGAYGGGGAGGGESIGKDSYHYDSFGSDDYEYDEEPDGDDVRQVRFGLWSNCVDLPLEPMVFPRKNARYP